MRYFDFIWYAALILGVLWAIRSSMRPVPALAELAGRAKARSRALAAARAKS